MKEVMRPFVLRFLAILLGGCGLVFFGLAHAGEPSTNPDRAEIIQKWQMDYPVNALDRLPSGQRDRGIGYIGQAKDFTNVWKSVYPTDPVPEVNFVTHLVLFARNTQFYNRINIGLVRLNNGVAEMMAMETMSAMPIEDKVAMSLAVVARDGIEGIQYGDTVILVGQQP